MTLFISATALLTWSMPEVCSLAVAAISETMSVTLPTPWTISPSFWATCLAVTSPSVASLTDWRMSSSVLVAASLARRASERTSSATTAKPRPASPARAASTAAFRARRLVWKAMSLMSRMIWEVPSAEALILPMAACICSMEAAPSVAAVRADWARPLAWEAFSADWRVMPETESMELEVSSREEACSEAPEATAWEEAAIWVAAEETCSTASATWAIASWRARRSRSPTP